MLKITEKGRIFQIVATTVPEKPTNQEAENKRFSLDY